VRLLTLCLILFGISIATEAQELHVRLKDASSKAPVPFAAIRLGNSGQGVIADLDGLAVLPATLPDGFIEISALGYEKKRLEGRPDGVVYLKSKNASLNEVVVKPDYDKIRRIIRKTVARRDDHNPERYDWYRCKVYYKMIADMAPTDSSWRQDTSRQMRQMSNLVDSQHLLISETYSRRTFKKPQQLQEEVLATRFSGFKSPMFASLVTDVLPFHCYTDYISLNGRDFRNPLSNGSGQWFSFNLHDEMLQGGDTLWIISFFPKKVGDGLRGQVYITSKDYAVTNLIAEYKDTVIGSRIRVEQRYTEVDGKWFPQQLNYIYKMGLEGKKGKKNSMTFGVSMQGTSRIDSVSFHEATDFRFDKRHTVKLEPAAASTSDSAWRSVRPEQLDKKEMRTYVLMDSLMEEVGGERIINFVAKLAEGKIGIGPLDINLDRVYHYNSFEGSRWGVGLQTNDSLSKHFSVGAWAGYGLHDARWKWGGFAEVYLDAYKESSIKVGYEQDLRDPGRIQLHPELDNNYLRNYLIYYADAYKAYELSLNHQFGYLATTLSFRREDVSPQYEYAWNWEGRTAKDYATDEVSLRLRYAFAERSAPVFGKYYTTGTRYPIVYAKGTYGKMDIGGAEVTYVQTLAALSWQKHITRIGMEQWRIMGGKIWSDMPLPIGKLYAPNAIRQNDYPTYLFGGLETLAPYTYYMDAFVSGTWKHDFDWRFYRADFGGFGSMPGLSLIYNGLWGTLSNPGSQQTFPFIAPDKGYHEGGAMLRDVFRIQYLNLAFIGLNAGYFYPLQPSEKGAGRYVLGLNVTL
jgi:hypothetical protein